MKGVMNMKFAWAAAGVAACSLVFVSGRAQAMLDLVFFNEALRKNMEEAQLVGCTRASPTAPWVGHYRVKIKETGIDKAGYPVVVSTIDSTVFVGMPAAAPGCPTVIGIAAGPIAR